MQILTLPPILDMAEVKVNDFMKGKQSIEPKYG